MTAILIISMIMAIGGFMLWKNVLVNKLTLAPSEKKKNNIFILLLLAFFVRLVCTFFYSGHSTDMSCFTGWADKVFSGGIGAFYTSEGFNDYPPGYMYVLYVLGAIKHLLSLNFTAYCLLVKLPAIICDIIAGYVVYKIASRKTSEHLSLIISSLYLFNPATIVDSALWGQVDSVYAVLLLVMIWLITLDKLELSYFVFAVCILIKPQAFIYTPVILFAIVDKYIYPKFDKRALLKTILIGILAILAMLLLAMPFGLEEVISQYTKTIGEEYPYFTINAFNIWGMFGMNWQGLTPIGTVIGYVLIIAIVIFTAIIFFKSKNESKYYYTAAMLAFLTFMLSTKMHERYGFPVMLFLLLAFVGTKNLHSYILYILVTISQFFNYAWVLFVYETDINKYAFCSLINVASFINVVLLVYVLYVSNKLYIKNDIKLPVMVNSKKTQPKNSVSKNPKASAKTTANAKKSTLMRFTVTKKLAKITKVDVIIIAVIMLIYSPIAIYDLGDMDSPDTSVTLTEGASRLTLPEETEISKMRVYVKDTDISNDNAVYIMLGVDTNATHQVPLKYAKANSWVDVNLGIKAKYVTLFTSGNNADIGEIEVYNDKNKLVTLSADSKFSNALIDNSIQSGTTLASTVFETEKENLIDKLTFFLGAKEINSANRPLMIAGFSADGNMSYHNFITSASVFKWNEFAINTNIKRVVLTTTSNDLFINEFALKDKNNSLVTPTVYINADARLFDEQNLVPERSSFRNSTYFDEIYHARTAYEFTESMDVYEWTHPPLGKVFIAIGIKLFGMCPFGWRIIGVIFGILMIPIIYIFSKKLLSKTSLATVTCLLFTFDFMHFAQTRIATIDVYVTFFIMLMYLFMYKYTTMSFYDSPLKKTFVPLALCGIAMGLGVASKWTGAYAGVGLAIIFFYTIFKRYKEYTYALKTPAGETDGISHRHVIESFYPCLKKTIGMCFIFFVAIPIVIYGLSYIPYLHAPSADGIKTIFQNQEAMLTYHGSTVLGSTHPYSSRWYEWIIMTRPIWFYSGTVTGNIREGISSFGNPLLWWPGFIAFLYLAYNAIKNRDRISMFLCVSYLAQLVPWMGIERLTFIYHYFPCVPFLALMLGYAIKLLYDKAKNKKQFMALIFSYTAFAIILFIMFYPVLSGQPCDIQYADKFLKWFNSWVLL